jgi:hypothetical protein
MPICGMALNFQKSGQAENSIYRDNRGSTVINHPNSNPIVA